MRLAAVTLTIGLGASCASDGGTPPVTVTSVVITAPAAPPSFQTLGRTVQFSAEPRDGSGAVIPGTGVSWSSTNNAAATVNGSGLVTAVANGTTEIRASAGTVQSAPVVVTVSQVADTIVVTPGAVAFGAIGSTRQLAAVARDSSNAMIPGTPTVVWTSAGTGATASVSGSGLVTALAVGASDTAVATVGANVTRVPIAVTQVVASIVVTNTGADTIYFTGGTRTFNATVRDSQANPIPGQTVTWGSTVASVATVSGGGVATAVADGETNVQANIGAIVGQRLLTVRRYAAIFDLDPTSASITTDAGTQMFTIDARDSSDTALPGAWLARNTAVVGVSPASGASTTATATGNGMTFVIVSAGTRTDSAQVTVTGQAAIPLTAGVGVYDTYFRSAQNSTQNAAVDTVGVGGTVTWTWLGSLPHSVQSILDPTFTSSSIKSTGTHQVTFNATGTYQYQCELHAQMTGRIVVR